MLTTKEKDLLSILKSAYDLVPVDELYEKSMCDSLVQFYEKMEKLKELGLIEMVPSTCFRIIDKGV